MRKNVCSFISYDVMSKYIFAKIKVCNGVLKTIKIPKMNKMIFNFYKICNVY